MDDCMLEIMRIDASFMSTFTHIRRMTSANTFGEVEAGLQANIQERLQGIRQMLINLRSGGAFRDGEKLVNITISCVQSLSAVIYGIRIEYTNNANKHKAETLISSYHDEFVHLVSNLKRICEMHAARTTNAKNMKKVVDILNRIVDKLEIASDSGEDPVRPPTGPDDN